jgi:hypothetical protein
MECFVKSRGYIGRADYQWHHLKSSGEIVDDKGATEIYRACGFHRVIYDQEESYAIGRVRKAIVLLIAAVPSRTRTDFMGRSVSNSAMWVAADSDECHIRGLLARSLTEPGWIQSIFDEGIRFDDAQRFTADLAILNKGTECEAYSGLPPGASRISKATPTARIQLGEEIKKVKLPDRAGSIVVVTGVQSLRTLRKANVWRGLAEGLPSEQ